ncbi:MAG: glycerate kinase, partial [Proteobacteria bacterium]|nr:glycerate kinase [Pseudomonadota bacterium]
MRILIAPNSFKGSLSAPEVCSILEAELNIEHKITVAPLADGGDGTLAVLRSVLQGFEPVELMVSGPQPSTKVAAVYLWNAADREAFIELSLASGLALLAEKERNPEKTTTLGTGELLAHAIQLGATRLRIAIGGSATNDCAIGALAALG